MRAVIHAGRAEGTLAAPPSKSMAHRLLICAALSQGVSTVRGVDMSEDIAATADCLRALGSDITLSGDTVTVGGIDRGIRSAVLDCRESGSTMRFMLPICLALGGRYQLRGSRRLMQRNMAVYEQLCAENGIEYRQSYCTVTVDGQLKPGTFCVRGDISSQFISGIMFASLLMDGESRVQLTTALESRPYVDMTVSAIRQFGGSVGLLGDRYTANGGGMRACDCTVEGDYSNAAFFDALNLTGGSVAVSGLLPDSLQGDKIYRRHFEAICRGGAEIDLTDCPDLGPLLFALAALKGGARFTGTRRLRIKESDRVAAMAEELIKFGVTVTAGDNNAVVSGRLGQPSEMLCGHNDHRVVMALATLCTVTGGTVDGAEAVSKSLPDYFERLKSLGIRVELI